MRRVLTAFVILVVLAAGVAVLGPRPAQDPAIRFDASSIGPDMDAWLAQSEARVPNLMAGAEKRIVWADPAIKSKTDLALVYVHGFSATWREVHPLTEMLSQRIGANVFYMRLTGHGRDGAAMAESSMNAWVNDIAEAIAIGERLGNRVLLVATSSGATLATWAAAHPVLSRNIAGLVLISPNYAVHGASTGLLNMPWAEYVLPLIFGRTRSFEPHNAEHAKWWTTSYPSRAVFAMAAMLSAVQKIDYTKVRIPAVFIYSPEDKVVDHLQTRRVYSRWGGPKEIATVAKSDDPSHHVVAGDILSPSSTGFVFDTIMHFLRHNLQPGL